MKKSFWLAICAGLMFCTAAQAAIVTTSSVTVTKIYADANTSDVAFLVSTPIGGCYGFWLRPTDSGFKTAYIALTMAYSNQGTLVVYAYNDSLWPGSSSSFCRVQTILLES